MKNENDREKNKNKIGREISRRDFLKTMGSGAAIAATSDALSGLNTAEAAVTAPEETVRINLLINGFRYRLVQTVGCHQRHGSVALRI